jgi:hypothetical protein
VHFENKRLPDPTKGATWHKSLWDFFVPFFLLIPRGYMAKMNYEDGCKLPILLLWAFWGRKILLCKVTSKTQHKLIV